MQFRQPQIGRGQVVQKLLSDNKFEQLLTLRQSDRLEIGQRPTNTIHHPQAQLSRVSSVAV